MHLRLHLEYMMVFIAGQRLTKYFLANSDIWTLFRNANNSASSSAGNAAAGLFQSELPGKIDIGFWEWHYMGLLEASIYLFVIGISSKNLFFFNFFCSFNSIHY